MKFYAKLAPTAGTAPLCQELSRHILPLYIRSGIPRFLTAPPWSADHLHIIFI